MVPATPRGGCCFVPLVTTGEQTGARGDGVAGPRSTELPSSGAGIPSLLLLALCPELGILFPEAGQKVQVVLGGKASLSLLHRPGCGQGWDSGCPIATRDRAGRVLKFLWVLGRPEFQFYLISCGW